MKARKIELKTRDIVVPSSGEKVPFSYKDTLQVVIMSAGQGGVSTEDVLKAVDVNTELKKARGSLHLEETSYNWVLGKVNNFRWGIADEAIATFVKDIRSAPLVDLKE